AALAESIADLAASHGLRPGRSPSSTVAALRWLDDRVDALVLADSPLIAFGTFGMDVVADDRLANLRDAGLLQTGAEVRRRRNAEKQDPDGERWPRAKRHDDQALVLADFHRGR